MTLPNTSDNPQANRNHSTLLQTTYLLFLQLRPKQWTKNLLVFAALLFSIQIATWEMVLHSLIGFVIFSFSAGAVYIFNDYRDRQADREHPEKRHRPMASGKLSPHLAIITGLLLLLLSIGIAYSLNLWLALLIIGYVLLNIAYTMQLKHVVIMDLLIIASGYVFRAVGGGLIIGVAFTPWFLFCTMWLALFLAISKRRHEFILLQHNKGTHRKVLEDYSADLLNQLNSIVTTATIMSYTLFTFTSEHTIHLMWSIPFVIYGVFRYLYLIHIEEKGGRPEKVVLEDKHILITIILFALTVGFVLYYFE